jgi:hypothetical protein
LRVCLMPCTRRLTLLIQRGLLRTLGYGRTSENRIKKLSEKVHLQAKRLTIRRLIAT